MIKRSFYKLLAIGNGRQLFLLLVATLVVIAIGVFLGEFVFKGGLDIILVVFGFLLVSTFFACIFANIFKNVAQSVRSGDSRYNFSGHVLILGAGHQLKSLLLALKGDDREVVVVSSKHVGFKNDCIYYKGSYEDEQVLATVGALSASAIYVIGEDDPEHDSKSLHCLEVLRKICKSPDHDIHCYLSLRDQTTFEVFCYLKLKLEESRFMVDIFSEYEFMAEELWRNRIFFRSSRRKKTNVPVWCCLAQVLLLRLLPTRRHISAITRILPLEPKLVLRLSMKIAGAGWIGSLPRALGFSSFRAIPLSIRTALG